jgi:Cu-processing system permease protein
VAANGIGQTIVLCARQEIAIAVRSRWTQTFAGIFGALALAIAASGYILSGGSGVQDFARTAASLIQLVLLIVPLAAIVMGVLALTPERGAAELLFAQPVARGAVLTGMLGGLFVALAGAEAIGFGAAGIVIFLNAGDAGLGGFLLVGATSLVLTAIFLALAALVSVGQTGRRRATALARALVIWCALTLVLDIVVFGIASMLHSGQASTLLIVAALVNPIDAVRTGALLGVEGTGAFGPASLALLRFTGGPLRAAACIAVSLSLWIAVPCYLAMRRLSRIDIA